MANVENGTVSPDTQPGGQPAAPGRTRSGKPAGPAFKPMQHEDMDPQDFASMLEAYDESFRNMAEGEVVKGTVLKVTDTHVVVDVGYKSEGLIPVHEFLDEHGTVTVQQGDVVDVLLERTEDREGLRRQEGRHRPGDRTHQGRARRRHRRARIPPGLADRRAAGPQPRRPAR